MIEIFKSKPPKDSYILIKKYKNVVFRRKYSIVLFESFFEKFPEEKRGRKRFKQKEIQNTKNLIYEHIIQKGIKINADCIGMIKEMVDKEFITIKVSYFKKNG